MKVDEIGPHDTIRDVMQRLSDPEDYLRKVLENMTSCRREHGNAHVRIGITGQGKIPNHKITYIPESGGEEYFGSFDGRNPFKEVLTHEKTWSSATMSWDEVRELMGTLPGRWRKPK